MFLINLPFGILALLGILAFVPETARDRERPIDWFGFALFGIAIGALQMMLDRGELKDWFSSPEIIVEAVLAVLCFYMFLVHMTTHPRPFLSPRLFRDRNFVTGLFLIFMVGIVLLATMALLPPFLQNLKGYPVITVGFALAPRGIGTMVAMLIVGRLVNKMDPRLLMLTGLGMTALSLHQMAGFNLDTDVWALTWTGVLQGFGLGFIFVPLSAVTFSTLEPSLRTEATGLFSLLRNLGSSIGISAVIMLLSRNTQINHAALSEYVTPYDPALRAMLPNAWSLDTASGLAALNAEVTRQAATVAYLDDFRLMMGVTLLAIPLVFLLRRARRGPAPKTVIVD